MLELTIDLRREPNNPYYVQLYRYIREEIKSGSIPAGTRLPAIRRLSEHLHISRNTVEAAYLQLVAEGYVESRPRSGLYVVELEQDFSQADSAIRNDSMQQSEIAWTASVEQSEGEIKVDFRNGSTDIRHFPFADWNRISQQTMQEYTRSLGRYGHPPGEPGLRYELAHYLRHSRGVQCTPDQIIVGAGTQQLIMLLCQLIGIRQQPVAVEEPGYNGIKMVLTHLNYPIKPIKLEEDGIDVEAVRQSGVKLVYVTPSHQFPLGMVMSVHKRLKLLQWASEQDALIIEDDYDSEFRYQGSPIPALQGLDSTGSVVYMGTFSKSLLSGIRISYMVLPERLLSVYRGRVYDLEPTASMLHTHTLERFMAEGYWEKHLRKMKKVYSRKHTHLLAAIERYLGKHVSVIGQHSGLHLVLEVHMGHAEQQLIALAADKGVKVYGTSHYWIGPHQQRSPQLLLGFGGLTEQELEEGVRLLQEAWL